MRKMACPVIAALALIAGCGGGGLEGTWVTRSVEPANTKEFKLGYATFKPDSTFEANVQEGGMNRKSKGSYTYDVWTKKLTLTTNGKTLAYDAVVWWGDELRVKKTMPDGSTITTRMDRTDEWPEPVKCTFCEKCPTCQSRMKAAGG